MSNRHERRVDQLLDSSQQVLDQCALPNGAIVAANSDLDVYPPTAENYRFSWARDAAFQLLATHALMPKKVARKRAIRYAQWLQRIPDFTTTGIYLKRYGTNGSLDVRYGEHFQPDQAGALIGALDTLVPDEHPDIDRAIFKLAIGLGSRWDYEQRNFGATQDLWENRETSAEDGDVFTYSVAAVHHGLTMAADRLQHVGTKLWEDSATDMEAVLAGTEAVLKSEPSGPYLRKIYPSADTIDADNTLDASLAGLAYPFNSHGRNRKVVTTTLAIDRGLYIEGHGVSRYKGDTYDGIVREGSQEHQAGTWPLLTFWHAIALNAIGKPLQAQDVYYDMVERLDYEYRNDYLPDNLIPEQLYPDRQRQGKGVLPLAWSHAKFVLATKALEIR